MTKKWPSETIRRNNYGYDDDRGDYLVIPHDHLAYRYEIHDHVGKGFVWSSSALSRPLHGGISRDQDNTE